MNNVLRGSNMAGNRHLNLRAAEQNIARYAQQKIQQNNLNLND
jgi:hypothetical protein